MARLLPTDQLWWDVMGHSWLGGAQVLGHYSRGCPVLPLAWQTPGREMAGVFYCGVLLSWLTPFTL